MFPGAMRREGQPKILMVGSIPSISLRQVGQNGPVGQNGLVWKNGPVGRDGQNGRDWQVGQNGPHRVIVEYR